LAASQLAEFPQRFHTMAFNGYYTNGNYTAARTVPQEVT